MLAAEVSMSSQPGAGGRPPVGGPAGRSVASAYSPAEWRLLTRLPGQVVSAALAAFAGGPGDKVAHAVAGLDGIAAGRSFDSDLVRAVAAAIYAESDRDLTLDEAASPPTEVLARCRSIARLLARRADPADAAAYLQWVQSTAARVASAAPEPGGNAANRWFLTDLGRALGLA
jgi:hypothetical protein